MPGKGCWRRGVRVSLIGVLGLLAACADPGDLAPRGLVAGRVSDERGQPLPGVVVTDRQRSVLSDVRGRFSLPMVASSLRFTKPGYRVHDVTALAEKQVSIKLLSRRQEQTIALYRVGHDDAYRRLEAHVADVARLAVLDDLRGLKTVDVLVLPAPTSAVLGRTAQILDWVKNGGRLILCGEWGGYPAADLDALNALSRPAGIVFTGGTVRDPLATDFRVAVSEVELPPLEKLSLTLFGATTLEVRTPARAILRLGAPLYSIQAAGASLVVAAVAPWGAGKVFALGDSSLWRDEDSSGTGVANAELPGHRQFLQALLEW